jgi:CheY-like chemotaxis protein
MALPDPLRADAQCKGHVLVVENDPEQRANLLDLLTGWGYEVSIAEAQANAADHHVSLREAVFQQARERTCHLLLIDMRLESDEAKEDNSGQKLAEQLVAEYPALRVIIRSGYREPPPPSQWLHIGKGDGAEELKLLIEKLLAHLQVAYPESGGLS